MLAWLSRIGQQNRLRLEREREREGKLAVTVMVSFFKKNIKKTPGF